MASRLLAVTGPGGCTLPCKLTEKASEKLTPQSVFFQSQFPRKEYLCLIDLFATKMWKTKVSYTWESDSGGNTAHNISMDM